MRTCSSFSTIFGVVPEEIRAWKPDTAPQAMVMNRKGNRWPENTGPLPSVKRVTACMSSGGLTMMMPKANAMMVPIFRKVER